MTQSPIKPKLTFEEYLTYDDGTDHRYELIDGELVLLPPESGINDEIATQLLVKLAGIVALSGLISLRCEVQVSGNPANRWPDLVVMRPEHKPLTEGRRTITLDMPPPRIVVEVVSPGITNRNRDYQAKRRQYQARGIPEYWILDPQDAIVTILKLGSDGEYQKALYKEAQLIRSQEIPEIYDLRLTAEQLLGVTRRGLKKRDVP